MKLRLGLHCSGNDRRETFILTIVLHAMILLGGISIAGGAAVEQPGDEASRYLGEIERKFDDEGIDLRQRFNICPGARA